jgi:hypothetical protein
LSFGNDNLAFNGTLACKLPRVRVGGIDLRKIVKLVAKPSGRQIVPDVLKP